jgi:hypothetical protein
MQPARETTIRRKKYLNEIKLACPGDILVMQFFTILNWIWMGNLFPPRYSALFFLLSCPWISQISISVWVQGCKLRFVIALENPLISSRSRTSSNFFSLLLLGIANSSCPSSQLVGSSKLLPVGLWLILGHNNCRRGSSILWLHKKMWTFISII